MSVLEQLKAAYLDHCARAPEIHRALMSRADSLRARERSFNANAQQLQADTEAVKSGRAVVYRGATIADRGAVLAEERAKLRADLARWVKDCEEQCALMARMPEEVDSLKLAPLAAVARDQIAQIRQLLK